MKIKQIYVSIPKMFKQAILLPTAQSWNKWAQLTRKSCQVKKSSSLQFSKLKKKKKIKAA